MAPSLKAIYNHIGIEYSAKRHADPSIAEQLHHELKGATRIINIGAGTGSYEPADVNLLAVEPSSTMISQRKAESHEVVQAFAENLPVADKSFSHAMTVLSMHHWEDRAQSFQEINRVVSDRLVAITWDPASDPYWLTQDYFPEIYELDKCIFPDMDELSEHFDEMKIDPLLIPHNCQDGFLAAYWQRPEAYLEAKVRKSISSFTKIEHLSEGLKRLRRDLLNGDWAKNNRKILDLKFLDVGYKLITARVRA